MNNNRWWLQTDQPDYQIIEAASGIEASR